LKAIVIGSSTGIGRALVKALDSEGYEVGITGRDRLKLEALRAEIKDGQTAVIDLREIQSAKSVFQNLVQKMHPVDLVIINAGILPVNPNLDWGIDEEAIDINVAGFAAIAAEAILYFEKQHRGHLVGVSSIAMHRGSGRAPAYNASKAFMSVYMEGLRQRVSGGAIQVTDIRPGFVRTQMIEGRPGIFLDVSAERAACDIMKAIHKRKKVAYIPGRWWWVAQFYKRLPEWIYHWAYRKYISRPDYKDFPDQGARSHRHHPE